MDDLGLTELAELQQDFTRLQTKAQEIIDGLTEMRESGSSLADAALIDDAKLLMQRLQVRIDGLEIERDKAREEIAEQIV